MACSTAEARQVETCILIEDVRFVPAKFVQLRLHLVALLPQRAVLAQELLVLVTELHVLVAGGCFGLCLLHTLMQLFLKTIIVDAQRRNRLEAIKQLLLVAVELCLENSL